jgi:hypothetical protein
MPGNAGFAILHRSLIRTKARLRNHFIALSGLLESVSLLAGKTGRGIAMRRLTIGVILLAMLAVPASAQRGGGGGGRQETPEEILKKKDSEAVDKQYNSTLKRLKQDDATPVRTDPWANMRAPATNDAKR